MYFKKSVFLVEGKNIVFNRQNVTMSKNTPLKNIMKETPLKQLLVHRNVYVSVSISKMLMN